MGPLPCTQTGAGHRPAFANARLHVLGGSHPVRIKVADSFSTRLRGLLFRPPLRRDPLTEGLLLTACSSVHTLFMRYPIDLAYLDPHGVVVRCVVHLAPWRGSFGGRAAAHVLELPAGSIDQWHLRPGHRLEHPALFPDLTA